MTPPHTLLTALKTFADLFSDISGLEIRQLHLFGRRKGASDFASYTSTRNYDTLYLFSGCLKIYYWLIFRTSWAGNKSSSPDLTTEASRISPPIFRPWIMTVSRFFSSRIKSRSWLIFIHLRCGNNSASPHLTTEEVSWITPPRYISTLAYDSSSFFFLAGFKVEASWFSCTSGVETIQHFCIQLLSEAAKFSPRIFWPQLSARSKSFLIVLKVVANVFSVVSKFKTSQYNFTRLFREGTDFYSLYFDPRPSPGQNHFQQSWKLSLMCFQCLRV